MKDMLVVSVYFWKDRIQFMEATDPYYQIPSDGICGWEMRQYK